MKLLVLGANGDVGQAIVEQAIDRGDDVIALERSWKGVAPDKGAVERVEADVTSDDLAPHVERADAVISALGLGLSRRTMFDPPPLYTASTCRLTAAMRQTGVKRLIVISAAFASRRAQGPLWFRMTARQALARVYAQMAEMERMLQGADDLDWTAVRPGWLLDRPLTRDYRVMKDRFTGGIFRTRQADLAHFMLALAGSDAWVRQTPAIGRRERGRAERPAALLEDLKALLG